MHKNNYPSQTMAQSRNIVLTSQQVSTVLDTTANQPRYRDLHDAVKLMLRSGIRPGELAGLRWTDFQFGLRVMRIKDHKTGLVHGTILNPDTVATMQARRDREDAEYVMGHFPHRALARVARQFRHLGKKLDLPSGGLHILRRTANVHRLRHTYATRLANAGISSMMLKDF